MTAENNLETQSEASLQTYIKVLLNRLTKLGDRDVFVIDGKPVDMPADSHKAIQQCRRDPKSFIGRYTKAAGKAWLIEDIEEGLKRKLL